jgi:hypothetical protein
MTVAPLVGPDDERVERGDGSRRRHRGTAGDESSTIDPRR